MSPTILLANGRYFDLLDPEGHEFDIDAIAHALAHLCRFTGHVRRFYSVAQHSVLVSHVVPQNLALAGLLHDASEAFLGDVAAPLKRLLPEYQKIEARVAGAIAGYFGVTMPEHAEVKRADLVLLATEKRDLMPRDSAGQWPIIRGVAMLPQTITPWTPEQARDAFLDRFYQIEAGAKGHQLRLLDLPQ